MFQKEIDSFLAMTNTSLVAVLHQSVHKRTTVLKIEFYGRPAIAKIYFEGAPKEIADAFVKERQYYTLFSENGTVPSLLKDGGNYLILEFVESQSLLTYYQQHTISEETSADFAKKLAGIILYFNTPAEKKQIIPSVSQLVILSLRRLKDLVLSGAKNAPEHSPIKLNVLKFIFYFSLPFLSFGLYLSLRRLVKYPQLFGVRYHGDLHMNNILLKEGSLYLIDFECAAELPLMLIDAAYCFGTFNALSQRASQLDCFLENFPPATKSNLSIVTHFFQLFESITMLNSRLSPLPIQLKFRSVYRYMKSISLLTF